MKNLKYSEAKNIVNALRTTPTFLNYIQVMLKANLNELEVIDYLPPLAELKFIKEALETEYGVYLVIEDNPNLNYPEAYTSDDYVPLLRILMFDTKAKLDEYKKDKSLAFLVLNIV